MERICALETIFRTIVKSGVDPTVGGMMVRVKWQETTETFEYMSEFSSISSSWPQTIKSGDTIKFYQGPEKGSYCCNVYQSNKNFCCYIYEACMGIVYTDEEVYDEHLAGMKFPKLYKVCVEEFDDIAQFNGAHVCGCLG